MTMGLVMVGAIETNKSEATLEDVTPIARLTSEQEAIVVPADSPYKTLEDFVADVEGRPGQASPSPAAPPAAPTRSSPACSPRRPASTRKAVNYVAYSGGGEALAAILGGKVAAGISGVSEFTEQVAAGDMRALAVSGAERGRGLRRADHHRGRLRRGAHQLARHRRPGGPERGRRAGADRRRHRRCTTARRGRPRWTKNGWDDAFLPGDEFAAFLTEEKTRVVRRARPRSGWSDRRADVRTATGGSAAGGRRGRSPRAAGGQAELGLAALLVALGAYLLVETAADRRPGERELRRPALLPDGRRRRCSCLVGSVARRRRPARRPRRHGGRRRTSTSAAPSDWKTLGPAVGRLPRATPRCSSVLGFALAGAAALLRRRRRPSAAAAWARDAAIVGRPRARPSTCSSAASWASACPPACWKGCL